MDIPAKESGGCQVFGDHVQMNRFSDDLIGSIYQITAQSKEEQQKNRNSAECRIYVYPLDGMAEKIKKLLPRTYPEQQPNRNHSSPM
jgi:hypothetical protein